MKKSQPFHFKKFSVRHDQSGMKVGTDGVLLGAWANIENTNSVLDIGTGTGVIALMIAQRTPSSTLIDAVDIDPETFTDALQNIEGSPWPDRIIVHNCPIQHFDSEIKFDLIVSNPPYFINSLKPPNPKRLLARHTQHLNFKEILEVSRKLLSPAGRLSVIFPFNEGLEFISLAEQHQFHCIRKWSFKTRKDKPIERLLLEFSMESKPLVQGEITLYEKGDEWSEGYKKLTQEFYLKL